MNATFRLMQESGVSGPSTTVELQEGDGPQAAKELAVAWSQGQTGHPWDVLTVEIPELEYSAEITD